MKKLILIIALVSLQSCSTNVNLITDYPPKAESGLINVVVEIPAGTSEKWEVEKSEGKLVLEFRNNQPRIIKYLPYPFNYGMIPRSLLARELGGDGDPLDAIVIGDAVGRGSVVEGKVIGVLKMLDGGEQDDKIIVLSKTSPLYFVNDIDQLDSNFRGISKVIEIWFSNYKRENKIKIQGFGNKKEANDIIQEAIYSYSK